MIDYRIPLSCKRWDCVACGTKWITDAENNKVKVGECSILTYGAKINGNTHRLEWETYTPTCPFFKTKEQQEEGRKKHEKR